MPRISISSIAAGVVVLALAACGGGSLQDEPQESTAGAQKSETSAETSAGTLAAEQRCADRYLLIAGRIRQAIDNNGLKIFYKYLNGGGFLDITEIRDTADTSVPGGGITTFVYDANKNVHTIIDPAGNRTVCQTDGNGLCLESLPRPKILRLCRAPG